jgi:hypothetical protein
MGADELKFQTDRLFKMSQVEIKGLKLSNDEARANIKRFFSHLAKPDDTPRKHRT